MRARMPRRSLRPSRRARCLHGRLLALLLATALMAAPSAALAEETRGAFDRIGGWAFDLLILRPVSLTQTLGGSAVLLVAYPISMPSGHQDTVLERCTLAPFEDTFERRLGDF